MADTPIRTADSEIEVDEATGEVVREIEHFQQGDHRYRIIWENGEPHVEDEPEAGE